MAILFQAGEDIKAGTLVVVGDDGLLYRGTNQKVTRADIFELPICTECGSTLSNKWHTVCDECINQ